MTNDDSVLLKTLLLATSPRALLDCDRWIKDLQPMKPVHRQTVFFDGTGPPSNFGLHRETGGVGYPTVSSEDRAGLRARWTYFVGNAAGVWRPRRLPNFQCSGARSGCSGGAGRAPSTIRLITSGQRHHPHSCRARRMLSRSSPLMHLRRHLSRS